VEDLFDRLTEQLESIGTNVLQLADYLIALPLFKLEYHLLIGALGHHVSINSIKIVRVFFLERVRLHKIINVIGGEFHVF
jgi:hypothetical protein